MGYWTPTGIEPKDYDDDDDDDDCLLLSATVFALQSRAGVKY